ncbi:hypothetical protein TSUD_341980 [Trifolium subterraneum]|nr:hypothetical protein TSUD_341980 [Trifolium subterraneum]
MEIGGRRLKNVETMAVESVTQSAPPPRSKPINTFMENPKIPIAVSLLIADSILIFLIIAFVPYTKIDWDAYMSQVEGFLGGERDYRNLKGDTGPLVYPAGFLYIYSAFLYLTGGQVYPAQLPWWALCLLSLSKRVHSIFVLRLFNDCVAMTFLHAALLLLMHRRWNLGLIVFSVAVSVKMNVLLYAPPLLLLMLKAMDISGVLLALAGAALVQILMGLPFLVSHPVAYISGAFNLGRVFIHFWSVNFKFIPEPVFVSKGFAIFLLAAHLIALASFAHYRWCKHEGGLLKFLHSRYVFMRMKFALFFSSSSQKFGKSTSTSIKILTKERKYRDYYVRWKLHWHCMRSVVALSILFMVLLYLTVLVVENALPNIGPVG